MLSTVISLSGCAATNGQVKSSYKVVAASSENQPGWLSEKATEKSGYVFFVGRADGVTDLSRCEDQAEAQAKALIRGEIREHLRRKFEADLGKTAAGKHALLDVALTKGLADLDLNGVTPVERYWERIEVPVADGTSYAYRLALLVRMPKDRFEETRAQAYQSVASQIGQ
jgi:hypothetical protein